MKATDLMIGDWVFHFGEVAQIVGIRIDNYNNSPYFKTNLHDTWYESGVDGIEPIPLTPEILEKNGLLVGYKKAEIIYYHIWEDFYLDLNGGEILLKLRRECGYDFTFFGIISCKYVHELQHALKLCKIDKQIRL